MFNATNMIQFGLFLFPLLKLGWNINTYFMIKWDIGGHKKKQVKIYVII